MEYAPAQFHQSERKLAEPGEPFAYTPENQAKFDEIVTRYPPTSASRRFSTRSTWRSSSRATSPARRCGTSPSRFGCTAADVEDVVSYYTMFYTKPVGKYVLNVCRTLSCALLGAERVTEELSAKLGIKPGQTTADGMFTLIEVECLGACDRAPVVMVNDDWHERLAPEQAAQFVDDIRATGQGRVHRLPPARGEEVTEHGVRTGPHQTRPRAELLHARLLPEARARLRRAAGRR